MEGMENSCFMIAIYKFDYVLVVLYAKHGMFRTLIAIIRECQYISVITTSIFAVKLI
jgi:hypothetical protein